MKRTLKFVCLAIMILVMTACVSSKEYKAKLAEVQELSDRVSTLEGELQGERTVCREKEEAFNAEIERLKIKMASLQAENTEISGQMEAEKLDLVKQISGLQRSIKAAEINRQGLLDEYQQCATRRGELEEEAAMLREERRKAIEERKKNVSELKSTYDELVNELSDEIQKGRIAVSQLQDKLSLSLVDKILFDSGRAEVNREGRKVLDRVAEILAKVEDKQVRIEGHTDNVGIGASLREKFPSNWELSTARATNVVRYLQEAGGLDPAKLSAAGYSQYKPVASNDTEEDRAKNRRIEIVLVPLDVAVEAPAEEESMDEGTMDEGSMEMEEAQPAEQPGEGQEEGAGEAPQEQ